MAMAAKPPLQDRSDNISAPHDRDLATQQQLYRLMMNTQSEPISLSGLDLWKKHPNVKAYLTNRISSFGGDLLEAPPCLSLGFTPPSPRSLINVAYKVRTTLCPEWFPRTVQRMHNSSSLCAGRMQARCSGEVVRDRHGPSQKWVLMQASTSVEQLPELDLPKKPWSIGKLVKVLSTWRLDVSGTSDMLPVQQLRRGQPQCRRQR